MTKLKNVFLGAAALTALVAIGAGCALAETVTGKPVTFRGFGF